jgi:hypothetical protein
MTIGTSAKSRHSFLLTEALKTQTQRMGARTLRLCAAKMPQREEGRCPRAGVRGMVHKAAAQALKKINPEARQRLA